MDGWQALNHSKQKHVLPPASPVAMEWRADRAYFTDLLRIHAGLKVGRMELREQLTNSEREKRTSLLGNTAMTWLMVLFSQSVDSSKPGAVQWHQSESQINVSCFSG